MALCKVLWGIAIAVLLALLVVGQGAVLRQRGYRLEKLKREFERQLSMQRTYTAQISRLQNPQRIIRLVQMLGLNLQQQTPTIPSEQEGSAGPAQTRSDTPDGTAQ